ncbi:hypothetical protein [Spiroplasma sp. ald]|uniref:hypothetical protein n=1 Tax=Spiroplasma sp. ald TaxID=2490849 RepID=UPI0037DD7164
MILKNAKIICEEVISNGWIEIKDNKIVKITAGHTDQRGYDLQQAIITGSDDTLTKILTVYQDYMKNYNKSPQARQICVHLEGPFISRNFKGAHDGTLLQEPNIHLLEKWIEASSNNIRIVTYAPEEENGTFTKFLLEHQILPSIGHSNATYDLVAKRVAMGVHHVTHLYNAMSKYDHR